MLNEIVSHYRVIEKLGGGGMGVVYRAEDLKLSREVALKFLPDQVTNDQITVERFQQEARAAAAINHPNTIPFIRYRPKMIRRTSPQAGRRHLIDDPLGDSSG